MSGRFRFRQPRRPQRRPARSLVLLLLLLGAAGYVYFML
jgi:hypothetical protein